MITARRVPHARCSVYRACPECRRNQDAYDAAAGTFVVLMVLTVCPVTVLLVMGAHGVAGMAGAWSAVAFLLSLPGLVALWSWLHPKP